MGKPQSPGSLQNPVVFLFFMALLYIYNWAILGRKVTTLTLLYIYI